MSGCLPGHTGSGQTPGTARGPSDRVGGRVEGAQRGTIRAAQVGRARVERREDVARDGQAIRAQRGALPQQQRGQRLVVGGAAGDHAVLHDVVNLAVDRERVGQAPGRGVTADERRHAVNVVLHRAVTAVIVTVTLRDPLADRERHVTVQVTGDRGTVTVLSRVIDAGTGQDRLVDAGRQGRGAETEALAQKLRVPDPGCGTYRSICTWP